MGITKQERRALHKKQERLHIKSNVPLAADLEEGVPALRSTSEGVVEYVKFNGVLYKKILDKVDSALANISDYSITWSANEPTAGDTNTIDDGDTVGEDDEGGQAIADLTAKVNDILSVLRNKNIIK